jgi:hypothetical protein
LKEGSSLSNGFENKNGQVCESTVSLPLEKGPTTALSDNMLVEVGFGLLN